ALQDREAALASRRDAVEPAHALADELAETVRRLLDRSADARLRPEHGHLRPRLRLLVAHRARDLARDAQIVEGSPRLLALRAEERQTIVDRAERHGRAVPAVGLAGDGPEDAIPGAANLDGQRGAHRLRHVEDVTHA